MATVATRACARNVDTNGDILNIAGNPVGKVRIRNIDSADTLQVQIPSIHDSSDWDEISISQEVIYESYRPLINQVKVKAKANTVDYQFGVVMP